MSLGTKGNDTISECWLCFTHPFHPSIKTCRFIYFCVKKKNPTVLCSTTQKILFLRSKLIRKYDDPIKSVSFYHMWRHNGISVSFFFLFFAQPEAGWGSSPVSSDSRTAGVQKGSVSDLIHKDWSLAGQSNSGAGNSESGRPEISLRAASRIPLSSSLPPFRYPDVASAAIRASSHMNGTVRIIFCRDVLVKSWLWRRACSWVPLGRVYVLARHHKMKDPVVAIRPIIVAWWESFHTLLKNQQQFYFSEFVIIWLFLEKRNGPTGEPPSRDRAHLLNQHVHF